MSRFQHAVLALALIACSGESANDGARGSDMTVDQGDADLAPRPDAPDALEDPGLRALEAFCGDDYAQVEERIAALLPELSLAEKVALMHGALGAPIAGAWETASNEAQGIPALRMLDGPRGVSAVAGSGTAFPVAIARGATWDPELEGRVGAAIGREVRAKGANVVLAPMLNLVTHPRWGRAQEGYGEDPHHVAELGIAFIEGAQRYVIASAKHFAANNIEDTRFEVNAVIDERTLREVYLPQFRRAVQEANVGSVMSAYNQLNGTYCSENRWLLRDVLKDEWAFQGFVESDWFFAVQSTADSANNGLDIEMPAARHFGNRLLTAVQEGEVDASVIDEAVTRILRTLFCFELDSDPPERSAAIVESAEHRDLALEVARRAIVLLENEADTLPLADSPDLEIAVLGPLADIESIGDTGSSNVAPSDVITPIEGLEAVVAEAVVVPVAGALDDESSRAAVAGADAVVVFLGLTAEDEGESLVGAGDRESLDLPPSQLDLLATVVGLNDTVVVVLNGGSAIAAADWIDDVDALLMAWYPGQMGGQAIAEILFGEVNPSGRLPLSFPVAESDLPPFDNNSLEVVYPPRHGYWHLEHEGTAPQFPFGFGLGYSRFEIANLGLSDTAVRPDDVVAVTVQVTNLGDRDGIETIQLYADVATPDPERPSRRLVGFTQAHLVAGQSEMVTIQLPVSRLATYDGDGRAWTVEPKTYRLFVGTSASDVPQTASFEVE